MAVSPTPTFQLAEYLEKLPGTTFRKLYQQPSTAFAIFRRMLPNLAQNFVMRMLYRPVPVSLADVEFWVRPDARKYVETAAARTHLAPRQR
jgi:transcription initiation factor TFIIH subunit 4